MARVRIHDQPQVALPDGVQLHLLHRTEAIQEGRFEWLGDLFPSLWDLLLSLGDLLCSLVDIFLQPQVDLPDRVQLHLLHQAEAIQGGRFKSLQLLFSSLRDLFSSFGTVYSRR